MSGKLFVGSTVTPNDPKLVVAYCEGRQHAKSLGTLTYATGATGTEGGNNGLTWTATGLGDGYRVNLIDPGVEGSPLLVEEFPTELNVYLETDENGAIISTAAEVLAQCGGLTYVSVDDTGASTGASVVAAARITLTGSLPKNGFVPGSDEATLFASGFATWTDNPANGTVPDCCSIPYGGGYSP